MLSVRTDNDDSVYFSWDTWACLQYFHVHWFSCANLAREETSEFEFYTPPQDSGGVLWFHVGCPSVRPLVVRPSIHPFPDDNLSKHQWMFTKLGMYIDMFEIWFGIANGQTLSK